MAGGILSALSLRERAISPGLTIPTWLETPQDPSDSGLCTLVTCHITVTESRYGCRILISEYSVIFQAMKTQQLTICVLSLAGQLYCEPAQLS